MKLTETHIQEIDNRLKKDGVKYWDIRIEMLDHVVTDVENRIENGEELEKAITNSFISLGWKGNFEAIVSRKQIIYQKKYRRIFKKEFSSFLRSIKTLFLFAFILSFCFYFSESKIIIKSLIFTFLFLFSGLLIYSCINYSKIFKSVYLLNSFTIITLFMSFFNVSLYFPKLFLGVEKLSSTYLTFVFVVLFPLFFVSFKLFFSCLKTTNRIYQKLISK